MTIFPLAGEAFSITGLGVGVDFNNDDFICWFSRVGDKLNKVKSFETTGGALGYDLWRYTTIGAGVTITPTAKVTKYGNQVFSVVTDATNSTGINVFKDGGGTISIATLASTTYSVHMQMRRISGGSGGAVPLRMQLRVSNDGSTTLNVDNSLPTTGEWVSFVGSYTTGAASTLNVRVFKNSHAFTATWEIAGIMIFEESTSVAAQAYNTGFASDLRECLNPKLIENGFKMGMRPHSRVGDENEFSCVVDNDDRLYSQEYTSSPLYGYLFPNRTLQVRHGSRLYYTGNLQGIKPAPMRFGERTAQLSAIGLKTFLEKTPVQLDYQFDITTDEPLRQALDEYDSTIDQSFIEIGDTTLDDYGANSKDELQKKLSIYAIGADLARAEQGYFYINEYNAPVFLNRYYNNGVASSATFDNDFDDISYVSFGERLKNRCVVRFYPRRTDPSTSIIFSLDNEIIIPGGETMDLLCPYNDENSVVCGARDVVTPTGGDYAKTVGALLMSFVARGQEGEAHFVNSGDIDVTVTVFNVRGRTIKTRNPMDIQSKNQSSINSYGVREMLIDMKGLAKAKQARDLGNFIIGSLSQEHGEMSSFTLNTKDNGTDNLTQLTLELFDIVTISEDQTYHLSTAYQIVGYEHSWDNEGMHNTRYYIELAPSENFWILGTSELDVTTVLGY